MKPATPRPLPFDDIDWPTLVPHLSRANLALARFDGTLRHLRNPSLLTTPLATREAVLSSKIEGTVVTVGEVLRFEAGDEPETESKLHDFEEVRNYRIALGVANRNLVHRPFNLNLLRELHQILLTSVRGSNKQPGQFRRVQNHIGRPGSSLHAAEFVPPAPEVLMDSLYNWEIYYHSEEKDALVQLALIHAQFEFLHPFLDGNGRIGRILIPLFLHDKKLLSSPTFYLSEYLEEHRDEYVAQLRQLDGTGQSWTRWCEFFLRAVAEQAEANEHKVVAVLSLYDALKVRVLEVTGSKFAVPILDAMFAQPIFQAGMLLQKENMPQRQFLMRVLGQLVEDKLLKVVVTGSGRRASVYSLHLLVDLCDNKPRNKRKRQPQKSGAR